MKVEQYKHANQYHLFCTDELVDDVQKDYLQSYDKLVVKVITFTDCQKIILGRYWDCSQTTSKHVYQFLEEYANIHYNVVANKKRYTEQLIETGVIEYDPTMY